MYKYLEYYQFHEIDENGDVVCLYCVVKENNGKISFQFIKDYEEALNELREFAYDNDLHTTDELRKSSKLHLQEDNKTFRELLRNKYDYDTSDIENFNDKIGHVEEVEETIDYRDVLNNKPVNKNKVIEKIKKLKFKGVKNFAVKVGIAVSVVALGIAGIKGCSKKGTTKDLNTESYAVDPQMVEAESEEKANANNQNSTDSSVNYDAQDFSDLSNESNFQIYLRQSCETTKNYMNEFKEQLAAFNSVARNYIDVSKNSRLGLDTDNYTAFQMAMLGSGFGSYADNVSTYWYHDDLYKNYVKTNDQLKQLATVQKQPSGFANALKGKERQDFYKKYENLIIDLNKTSDENEKIDKTENILSQIKADFNMDSDNYNPLELLKSNSKYVAVMPMVRSVYDRAKNGNYENIPAADKMKQLSLSYRKVVSNNILHALDSIDVKESVTPSYEMYMEEIARILDSVDLYVIDDERSIKDTALYQQNKTLPSRVVEVTPTPTPVTNNNVDVETIENTGVAEVDVPNYDTDDDNYVYQEDTDTSSNTDTTSSNTDTSTDTVDSSEDTQTDTTTEPSITDQIIESDEGTTDEITNDNSNSTDTVIDDNQIIESEEDIANSMNDAINNGGYAETPDGWQIDDDYKQDGTNTIDGSVSNITIEDSSATEEVPTTTEDTSTATEEISTTSDDTSISNEYGIIESEEDYSAPATESTYDSSASEESVITEETPVYDDTSYSTDTTESNPVYSEEVTTYETEEPVIEAQANVSNLTQDQVIDQVISYNANGINAIPVFNATNNSWHVEVVDTTTKEVQPMQYNI